jgi:hypothetical protein
VIGEEQARVRDVLIDLGERADRVVFKGTGDEPHAGKCPPRP